MRAPALAVSFLKMIHIGLDRFADATIRRVCHRVPDLTTGAHFRKIFLHEKRCEMAAQKKRRAAAAGDPRIFRPAKARGSKLRGS